ncbi:MAG TPA: hypothetical protein VGN83_20690 [Falsiroseomonas sp.]|jgi:hypothetical protein|nr:hypothetical protein [Falsiroseomonas sp.]
MEEKPDRKHEAPSPPRPAEAARAERDARLAAALRANLRKRKEQARARQAPTRNEPKG